MAVVAYAHSTTYTTTGANDLFQIDHFKNGTLGTVKAGASDVVSLEFQMDSSSQRVVAPAYRSLSNDFNFFVPAKVYAVGLNITTNASAAIILDLKAA